MATERKGQGMNWDDMTQDQRHDWLAAAGVYNFAFKFIDWNELPENITKMLNKVIPPHIGGAERVTR